MEGPAAIEEAIRALDDAERQLREAHPDDRERARRRMMAAEDALLLAKRAEPS